jgi:hypothetical protein
MAVAATSIQIVAYFPQPLGIGLSVYPEKWTAKLAKAFGLGKQDIVVGDDEFDTAFVVQGDEPTEVVRLLSPEFQRAVLDFASSKPTVLWMPGSIQVLDHCVCYTEGPYEDAKDEIAIDWEGQPRRIVDAVVRIAQSVDRSA